MNENEQTNKHFNEQIKTTVILQTFVSVGLMCIFVFVHSLVFGGV